MSLGFDAIAALPFATSGLDGDVNVSVTGNQVTITIGSVGVIADAVTEEADPNWACWWWVPSPNAANATKSLSSLHDQANLTMLVNMSNTNITINLLLEEALNEPDIGTTSRFRWHATAVGIAALWIDSAPPSTPPFENALKEGLNIGLDLSREEREFHQVEQGLVLLFHS